MSAVYLAVWKAAVAGATITNYLLSTYIHCKIQEFPIKILCNLTLQCRREVQISYGFLFEHFTSFDKWTTCAFGEQHSMAIPATTIKTFVTVTYRKHENINPLTWTSDLHSLSHLPLGLKQFTSLAKLMSDILPSCVMLRPNSLWLSKVWSFFEKLLPYCFFSLRPKIVKANTIRFGQIWLYWGLVFLKHQNNHSLTELQNILYQMIG